MWQCSWLSLLVTLAPKHTVWGSATFVTLDRICRRLGEHKIRACCLQPTCFSSSDATGMPPFVNLLPAKLASSFPLFHRQGTVNVLGLLFHSNMAGRWNRELACFHDVLKLQWQHCFVLFFGEAWNVRLPVTKKHIHTPLRTFHNVLPTQGKFEDSAVVKAINCATGSRTTPVSVHL